MRAWVWMTGGLILWAVHFLGMYGLSSLADVVARADDPGWRMIGQVFSGLCLLVSAALLVVAIRRLRRAKDAAGRFRDQLAALGAAIALVAIPWQALPTLLGY